MGHKFRNSFFWKHLCKSWIIVSVSAGTLFIFQLFIWDYCGQKFFRLIFVYLVFELRARIWIEIYISWNWCLNPFHCSYWKLKSYSDSIWKLIEQKNDRYHGQFRSRAMHLIKNSLVKISYWGTFTSFCRPDDLKSFKTLGLNLNIFKCIFKFCLM